MLAAKLFLKAFLYILEYCFFRGDGKVCVLPCHKIASGKPMSNIENPYWKVITFQIFERQVVEQWVIILLTPLINISDCRPPSSVSFVRHSKRAMSSRRSRSRGWCSSTILRSRGTISRVRIWDGRGHACVIKGGGEESSEESSEGRWKSRRKRGYGVVGRVVGRGVTELCGFWVFMYDIPILQPSALLKPSASLGNRGFAVSPRTLPLLQYFRT